MPIKDFPISRCDKKAKSFTLIELLIVIAIISILTVSTAGMFVTNSNDRNSKRAVEYFVSDIMLVRNKALSGSAADTSNTDASTYWNLYVTCASPTSQYRMGNSTTSTGTINNSFYKNLENGFIFDCGASNTVRFAFKRLTGQLANDVSIGIKNKSGNSLRTITVYKNGSIKVL